MLVIYAAYNSYYQGSLNAPCLMMQTSLVSHNEGEKGKKKKVNRSVFLV